MRGIRRSFAALPAIFFATALLALATAAPAEARSLRQGVAYAAAETRAQAGDLISSCERVSATRMDCWLLSFGIAEMVDGDTGETTPVAVEVYIRVFYRGRRLYTYMPLTDDRAVAVRGLMPRQERLKMQKAIFR